jgi:organic radical activating enzyme
MAYSTACSKSWTDVNVDFKRGGLAHCCYAGYHDFPDEYTSEFYNSEHIQKRRQDSLKGIQHPDCSGCWRDVKKGVPPFKEWMNEWDNFDNADPLIPQVSYIELNLDNTCDLSCLYCTADVSSKIAQEEGVKVVNKTREKDIKIFKEWLTETINNSTKEITIAFMGGEPTASKLFYEIIELIETLDASNVTLNITTNCNTKDFLFKKLLNAMNNSQCQWEMNISNESYKDDSKIIRYGLDWDRFEQNLRTYASHEKVNSILFDCAMNVVALPSFPKYITWLHNIMSQYDKKFTILGSPVNFPEAMDIAILPESFKTHMEEAIKLVTENQLPNWTNKENTLVYFEGLKSRIGSRHYEDYKNTITQFLEIKQKHKKTDKLMRLMDPLGETK